MAISSLLERCVSEAELMILFMSEELEETPDVLVFLKDIIENKELGLILIGEQCHYELVRISGNTYTTKTHDSLKISNGMWMWWSRGIGGRSAVDYLMRVRDMTFIEAVSQIANDESALRKQYEKPKPRTERNLIHTTKDNIQ